MYIAIRTLASRLVDNLRFFLDFLSGFDDFHVESPFRLEDRVNHLEAEVKMLRSLLGKPDGKVREEQ